MITADFMKGWWNCFETFCLTDLNVEDKAFHILKTAGISDNEIDEAITNGYLTCEKTITIASDYKKNRK